MNLQPSFIYFFANFEILFLLLEYFISVSAFSKNRKTNETTVYISFNTFEIHTQRINTFIKMETVAEAMEFFRFGNANKKSVVLLITLASLLLPYCAEAMPAPRKSKYFTT